MNEEFSKFVKETALEILNEQKIENAGNPIDLKMNKKAEESIKKTGAKVSVNKKGTFKEKTAAPVDIPKEFDSTEQPTDVKMTERNDGSDEQWATAAEVKGTNSKKPGTKNHASGLANPDVTSKKDMPNVSVDADPTKKGGISGDKENQTDMQKEDKEDKQTTPKTQVLGKGEKSKEGFSKGQTDQDVRAKAEQEKDDYKEKLDKQISTIQLPETFKNKKELIGFIQEEAKKALKLI